jgi:uncharacterized protein (TIGR03083 family)
VTLAREHVAAVLLSELDRFEELTNGLSGEDLVALTRYHEWPVHAVSAHVGGAFADVLAGRVDGLQLLSTATRQAREREGLSTEALAGELHRTRDGIATVLAAVDDGTWEAPAPGDFSGSLGDGVEALVYDLFLHADDIRAAVGRSSVMDRATLHVCLSHVAFELRQRGCNVGLALDEMPSIGTDSEGTIVRGDPLEFVLAISGRGDLSSFGIDIGPPVS